MNPELAARRLERLRDLRNTPRRATSLGTELERWAGFAGRASKAAVRDQSAWLTVVPRELADHAALARVDRGTAFVKASSDSVRFALDRWLRSGGLTELSAATRGRVVRVRVEIQPTP